MTTTFVADNRNILNEADATTGWTGTATPTNDSVTAAVDIEATDCLAMQVSTATDDAYVAITSDDYSQGGSLFVWLRLFGTMDTLVNGGGAIQVGDGTNRIGYHVAGSDAAGFRHNTGPVEWQCCVIDLANKPANFTAYAGSEASLDETAITQVGVGYKTTSKAVGGIVNCFWDIIRWADPGDDVVFVGGTTSGAAGNGSEVATLDRGTGNQQAYGVFHELGTGVYGIQGNITLGNTASSSDQYFTESNVTYAFENRGLSDRNYYRFNLVGSSTATNCEFSFTSSTFSVPSGAYCRINFNGADITVCTVTACSFLGVNTGIVCSDDTGDDWTGNSFSDCGVVEIEGADHTGSSFSGALEGALTESQDETSYDDTTTEGGFTGGSGYAASDTITLDNGALITVDAVTTGAVTQFTVTTSAGYPANEGQLLSQSTTSGSGTGFTLWPRSANLTEGGAVFYDVNADPDGELDDCSFTKGTAATHAIVFGPNIPTTMTLRGCDFSGYNASDSQTDSTLHFLDTTGTITLNLISCTGNISIKTEGCTVDTVISPVTTLINVKDNNGVNLQDARVWLQAANATGDLPFEQTINTIARSGTTATVTFAAAHGLQVGEYIKLQGITDKTEDNNGAFAVVTTPSATQLTYTTTNSGSTSYTGTITGTGGTLYGLTDVNGNISSSRSYSVNQPVTGNVRKSTTSPRFKTFVVNDTVNSSSGLTINIRMILDE